MDASCRYCHGRFEEFSRCHFRAFWVLVAIAAGFWLVLAIEVLRRSPADRRHWDEREGGGSFVGGTSSC